MIELVRLLVDFGLLILVWLVQLCIYPAFLYFSKENLAKWHPKYTHSIVYLVLPLMLIELIIYIYQVFQHLDLFSFAGLVLVILLWGNTFIFAVPIHTQMDKRKYQKRELQKLLNINAWRTGMWSFLFILSIYDYFK